jgi:glycosyltransferase domain-containing protein
MYELKQPFEPSIVYLHLPTESLMSKLEIAINTVVTPFLVMCADDDFIIPSAVLRCVDFLKKNKDYAVAQGNALSFRKTTDAHADLDFSVMYKHMLSFAVDSDDAYERLKDFFRYYRTLFYGVHYTSNLRLTFQNTAAVIKNLYLNEYLTGIIPIVAGKYKELNLFYQVREAADDSGDKTTINLDAITHHEKYSEEYNSYLALLVNKIAMIKHNGQPITKEKLSGILQQYAGTINVERPFTLKKRIGKALAAFPYFGKKIIEYNRRAERVKEIKQVIKTEADRKELKKVEMVIRKYTSSIK